MSESKSLRHEDLMFKRKHQLTRRSYTNTTNTTNTTNNTNTDNEVEAKQTKKKQTKKFSSQKRQILIFEALKKIPKKTYTKSGQVELANNDD